MKLLSQLNESIKMQRLVGADEARVKDAFFANYLSALLLLKLQDLKGLILINDKSHSRLTRFSDQMSDVNFWGTALFYSKNPEVANRMLPRHADVLSTEAGRIMHSRVQWLMQVPLTAPANVNWIEVIGSLILLKARFSMKSSYFRNILYYLANWDKLREAEKKRAVGQAFMYLLQSDPKSALLPRIRELQGSVMIKKIVDVAQTVIGFKRIVEDNAIVAGDSSATVSSKCDTTSVGNVNTDLQSLFRLDKMSKSQVTKKGKYVFRDNKLIKKRPKKFKPKKFKAPSSVRKNTYKVDQSGDE